MAHDLFCLWFLVTLHCQIEVLSHGVVLKSNQTVVGYFCNICDTIKSLYLAVRLLSEDTQLAAE